jgi:hypothetical protein
MGQVAGFGQVSGKAPDQFPTELQEFKSPFFRSIP